jgi:putative flippase GtrA
MSDIAMIDERKVRDRARLQKVAVRHGAAVLAAFTLWGAADAWALSSGLFLAEIIAMFNAIFAATAIAYIAHEWGHFTGARFSGAISPVAKEPGSFFMFTFKDELNTQGQFLAMSAGGSLANWTLVVLMCFMLPLETWSQALFLATTVAIAVSVGVFEIPIINRVMYGDDPTTTVQQRLKESGSTPRIAGIATGALVWLLAI